MIEYLQIILTIGKTDRCRQFHPFGYAVVKNEEASDFQFMFNAVKKSVKQIFSIDYEPKVLIADNAPSIHNGFKA